jgi:hypothetical protein
LKDPLAINQSINQSIMAPPGRITPDDDGISEVSGHEFDEDTIKQPHFKLSTADLRDDSKRNTRCCLIALGILCLAVAIGLSIFFAGLAKDKDDYDDPMSASDTAAGDNSGSGQALFLDSKDFVESQCAKGLFEEDPIPCQDTCAGFSCCDPFLPEGESCFQTNREGCIAYARCHILTAGGNDPPPTNLASICSPENIAKDPTACELQCSTMECCHSKENSCVATDFYACLDYSPCQNLRLDLEVPIPRLNILEQVCVPGVVTIAKQQQQCDDECEPASCCWDPDASCLESNFFTCLQYGRCDKLELPAPGQAVSPPSVSNGSIANVCSTFNFEEDPTACQTACAVGDCCSEELDVTNCFNQDPLGCLEYSPCKVFV